MREFSNLGNGDTLRGRTRVWSSNTLSLARYARMHFLGIILNGRYAVNKSQYYIEQTPPHFQGIHRPGVIRA